MQQTHYSVLQVAPNASIEVIDASWKILMRKYHPEGTAPDYEMAVRVNHAHDVLSDPQKRAQYDMQIGASAGPQWPRPGDQSPAGQPSGVPPYGSAYPAAYPNFGEMLFQSAEQHLHTGSEEFLIRLAEDLLPDAVDQFLARVPRGMRSVVREALRGRRRNTGPRGPRPGEARRGGL